jgi:hypothetical protein
MAHRYVVFVYLHFCGILSNDINVFPISSQDPRPNITGFIQGSTAGHFGHLYLENVTALLNQAKATNSFPQFFPSTYYVYQGERNIVAQVQLGGAGILAGGRNATMNWDGSGYGGGTGPGKPTFEDIDGLEVLLGPNNTLYAIIQEDSGSLLGDRMVIAKLEHDSDSKELTYYYVAMSGGSLNSRTSKNVGIPAGTGASPSAHEFSGVFDLSGFFYKAPNSSSFYMKAGDTGAVKRMGDALTPINQKKILIVLQAHSMSNGVVQGYRSDRGGQLYLYQPNIPV